MPKESVRNQSGISGRLFLVGGWTNPSEKYDRQIGNLPQIGGENEKCLKPPPRLFPSETNHVKPGSLSKAFAALAWTLMVFTVLANLHPSGPFGRKLVMDQRLVRILWRVGEITPKYIPCLQCIDLIITHWLPTVYEQFLGPSTHTSQKTQMSGTRKGGPL